MRKAAAALLAVFTVPALAAPPEAEKIKWLDENARSLRSLQHSREDDYADLYYLEQALKGVRVVGLGEATHGDGSTMRMKTRLVRYLHERLGFDVIAWEAGLFETSVAQAALGDPATPTSKAAGLGIYSVWTQSAQLAPLWDYIRERRASARPLVLAGFDCRLTGTQARGAATVQYLREFFSRAREFVDDRRWRELEQKIGKVDIAFAADVLKTGPLYDRAFVAQLLAVLEERPQVFRAVWGERDIAFARQSIRSLEYLERYLRERVGPEPVPEALRFTRDMGMGLNLLWLVEQQYPDRKIIVWAHSAHLENDFTPAATDADFRRHGLRGSSFAPVKHALGARAYSLAFLSSEGEVAYPNFPERERVPVPPSKAGSLQELLRQSGRELAFLDFSSLPADHWLRAPVEANFLFHGQIWNSPAQMILDWTSQFDGMIYIRRMEPSLPAQ